MGNNWVYCTRFPEGVCQLLHLSRDGERVWCAQPAVLPQVGPSEMLPRGSGRERGESLFIGEPAGVYTATWTCGEMLPNCERVHRRYCADVLVEEGIDLRSVEIHIGEVRHLCVLALQLEARGGEEEACAPPANLSASSSSSSSCRGNSVRAAAPLDCEITVSRRGFDSNSCTHVGSEMSNTWSLSPILQ